GHAQNRFFNEMEEWLSGVTRLVDTDDLPAGGSVLSAELLHGIDDHLRVLINQMQKNNQAMAVLLKQQKKTPDSSSDPTS
ncbi:MAG: biopolymer transporter ExbB, partial [Desulfotignum sp.]